MGSWVLSQAIFQPQPLLLAEYNDPEKLGAFVEAVFVDLWDSGKSVPFYKVKVREARTSFNWLKVSTG